MEVINKLFEGKLKINDNIIIGCSSLYAELKDDKYTIKQVQEINSDNNKIQIIWVDNEGI